MTHDYNNSARSFDLTRMLIFILMLWTAALLGTGSWNYRREMKKTTDSLLHQARAFFKEIVIIRYWNARNGGVFIPVSGITQPNPYLDSAGRDIVAGDGTKLTKVNPAYMTRQIAELATARDNVQFHITSLNPIRPANAPDEWETDALRSFSRTSREYFGWIESTEGDRRLRYMAPLWVEDACLKCHAKQGCREGDIRGGISISIPAAPMLRSMNHYRMEMLGAYLAIWALGVVGIVMGFNRLKEGKRQRENMISRLQEALAKVKTLKGLLPICASCKKIRDDKGYWKQLETYLKEHSDASFTHGLCPECLNKLYPEVYERLRKNLDENEDEEEGSEPSTNPDGQ